MMNEIILIIFSLLIMAIIGVVVYLIIDYFKYKDSVDESIKISSDNINKNFNTTSSNITLASAALDYKYNKITSGLTDTIKTQQTNVTVMSCNLNNFDYGLKKYFEFTDNTITPINDKIYNHVFTSINPNLNLISQVNVLSGMTVNSSHSLINSNNFRVCDDSSIKNCINLNVYNGNFNITPENSTNNLVINNVNKNPLANFDLKNNSIYLGAGDDTAPLYIHDCNLYVKNLNIINDPLNTTPYSTANSKRLDIDSINNLTNTIIASYTIENIIPANGTANLTNNILTIKLLSYNKIPINSTVTINIPEISSVSGTITTTSSLIGTISSSSISSGYSLILPFTSEIPPKTNIVIVITSGFNIGNISAGQKITNIAMATFT